MSTRKRNRRDSSSSDDSYVSKRLQRLENEILKLKERRRPSSHYSDSADSEEICQEVAAGEDPLAEDPSQDIAEYPVKSVDLNRLSNKSNDDEVEVIEEAQKLNPEVQSILGDDNSASSKLGATVHKDVATRWEHILKNGLDPEIKKNILKKYPALSNCPLVEPPKLNLEVKSAVSESAVRRDSRLADIQGQVGASLSALGTALTLLLSNEDKNSDCLKMIELISDAGRLLTDVHHAESAPRRILVGSSLNKNLKDTLTNVAVDGWLFGDNLGERVKTAKALERSSLDLKPRNKTQVKPRSNLNFKGPSRQYYKGARLDGQKTQIRNKQGHPKSQFSKHPGDRKERERRRY